MSFTPSAHGPVQWPHVASGCCTDHSLDAQEPHVASGCCAGQHRSRQLTRDSVTSILHHGYLFIYTWGSLALFPCAVRFGVTGGIY